MKGIRVKVGYNKIRKRITSNIALRMREVIYCQTDKPVSERTQAVWAIPDSPVKETAAADRIIFVY